MLDTNKDLIGFVLLIQTDDVWYFS